MDFALTKEQETKRNEILEFCGDLAKHKPWEGFNGNLDRE